MKISHDKEIDAAYIYLKDEIKEGEVRYTYPCDVSEVGFELNLDFDKNRVLLGIEVMNASRHLPLTILKKADCL